MSLSHLSVAYVDSALYPSATPPAIQAWHTCVGLAAHTEAVWLIAGRGAAQAIAPFYGGPQPANLHLRLLPRCQYTGRHLRVSWALLFHFLALWTLRGVIRRAPIAAVLTRDLKLAQFLLRAHRHRPLPPIVFESHQIYGDTLREEAARQGQERAGRWARLTAREAEVYRDAAGLLVLTHQMAALLPRRFETRGRIRVVPDGADPRLAQSVQTGAADGPVTYLGSFHGWKGVDVPLQALAYAPSLRLRLVGGAPEPQSRLEELARALHVSERVQFTGPVPPPTRWRYLAEASACALPLTRSVFGQAFSSPLKLFEYMAAARPIVASDVPVIREILVDGHNALLVPPEDPAAWAAALERLSADPALATRLATQAASDARSYTWEGRGERIASFLEAVPAAA